MEWEAERRDAGQKEEGFGKERNVKDVSRKFHISLLHLLKKPQWRPHCPSEFPALGFL